MWALLPLAAAAQEVTYDYNASHDFSAVKTFAVRPERGEDETEQTTTYDSPFVEARTYAAIAAQLESRGLKRDDSDPDVYVTTRRTFKTEYTMYSEPSWFPAWGYGYRWGWGSYYPFAWGGYSYTEETLRGTLTIDVADAATGALVWRGVGERSINPLSKPERQTRKINKEVAKIFRNFPR